MKKPCTACGQQIRLIQQGVSWYYGPHKTKTRYSWCYNSNKLVPLSLQFDKKKD